MTFKKRHEAGLASIETALVIPFLLVALLLVTQFVLLILAKISVQVAAEQAAEEASYYGGSNESGRSAASNASSQIRSAKNMRVDISRDQNEVTVIISAEPLKIIPVNLEVTSKASSPIERFYSEEERE